MKTQEKIMNIVLLILGIVLFVYGVGTPGLFPQLPLCFIGSIMIVVFLPDTINMFKRTKLNKDDN